MLNEINLCCTTEKLRLTKVHFTGPALQFFRKPIYLPVSQEPDYLPVSYSSLAERREEEKKCTS